jgi:hypothetical protein
MGRSPSTLLAAATADKIGKSTRRNTKSTISITTRKSTRSITITTIRSITKSIITTRSITITIRSITTATTITGPAVTAAVVRRAVRIAKR